MVLSIINSVSVAIVFPKHNRVQEPHTASAPTVAWRPAVAFLRGEGRSAGFSKTLNQYAYQNQHLVCNMTPYCAILLWILRNVSPKGPTYLTFCEI